MTLAKAAEILRNPKDHWSHEKDEATQVAKEFIIDIDNLISKYGGIIIECSKKEYEFPPQTVEAISGVSPV